MTGGETRHEVASKIAQIASDGHVVSGMIVAQILTDQDADNLSQVAPLFDQIDNPIGRVKADGAYDGALIDQTIAVYGDGIEVVILPRSADHRIAVRCWGHLDLHAPSACCAS